MSKYLQYKEYLGSINFSEEDEILHGKVEFIRDLISYHAEGAKELQSAFQEAIDDYLETCKQIDKEPDRSFKGSFNVRIGSELHRESSMLSIKNNISLNELVIRSLEYYLHESPSERRIYVYHDFKAEEDTYKKPFEISMGEKSTRELMPSNKDENLKYDLTGART